MSLCSSFFILLAFFYIYSFNYAKIQITCFYNFITHTASLFPILIYFRLIEALHSEEIAANSTSQIIATLFLVTIVAPITGRS